MSIKKFQKISQKKIQHTNSVFKTYKGEKILPLGFVTVDVEYGNQRFKLNLYIVKEDLDTLFGRKWLHKIKVNWNSIKSAKTDNSNYD